jgi:hypothetical protein
MEHVMLILFELKDLENILYFKVFLAIQKE